MGKSFSGTSDRSVVFVVSFTTHGFNKADILVKVASNIIKSDLLLEENDLHLNTVV